MELNWKASPGAPVRLIGYYSLNLLNLQAAGYISATKTGHVRLRFFHDLDDCIYIQPSPGSEKRLIIGRHP
jgi:hypothetical protein